MRLVDVVSVDDNDCDSMADGCLGLTDIRKFSCTKESIYHTFVTGTNRNNGYCGTMNYVVYMYE